MYMQSPYPLIIGGIIVLVIASYYYFPSSSTPTDPVIPQAETAAPGTQTNPYFEDNEMTGDMVDLENQSDTPDPTTNDVIIGMTVAEAQVYARTNGVVFRTGSIDGEGMPVTMDFRIGRITADLVDGVVVSYTVESE